MGTWDNQQQEGGSTSALCRWVRADTGVGCDPLCPPSALWTWAGLGSCQGAALALERLWEHGLSVSSYCRNQPSGTGVLGPHPCADHWTRDLGPVCGVLATSPLILRLHLDLLGAVGSRKAACQALCLSQFWLCHQPPALSLTQSG